MSLKEVLQAFLDHRLRGAGPPRAGTGWPRSRTGCEILDGYLIVYLNLDEVIRIIREEDEPKAGMIARFELTDLQAEAILNMRLRELRRLEEMELTARARPSSAPSAQGLEALLGDEGRAQRRRLKEQFAGRPEAVRRRRHRQAPHRSSPTRPTIDAGRCSRSRSSASRSPCLLAAGLDPRRQGPRREPGRAEVQGRRRRALPASRPQTTDKLLVFGTDGRFYTLAADKLPGGRGHGEPLRLMIDLDEGRGASWTLRVHRPEGRLVLATQGRLRLHRARGAGDRRRRPAPASRC